jgi:hypothetical protein
MAICDIRMWVDVDANVEIIEPTYLYSICSFYNPATKVLAVALGDPRGSAINEPKKLSNMEWLEWLALRSIATE